MKRKRKIDYCIEYAANYLRKLDPSPLTDEEKEKLLDAIGCLDWIETDLPF